MNQTAEKPPEPAKAFGHSSILPESEFRRVRARYEQFIEALSGRLSTHLRMDVGAHLVSLETGTFHEFIAGTINASPYNAVQDRTATRRLPAWKSRPVSH
jgi:hypothetical protein